MLSVIETVEAVTGPLSLMVEALTRPTRRSGRGARRLAVPERRRAPRRAESFSAPVLKVFAHSPQHSTD